MKIQLAGLLLITAIACDAGTQPEPRPEGPPEPAPTSGTSEGLEIPEAPEVGEGTDVPDVSEEAIPTSEDQPFAGDPLAPPVDGTGAAEELLARAQGEPALRSHRPLTARCLRRAAPGLVVIGFEGSHSFCRFAGAYVGDALHTRPRSAARAYIQRVGWAEATPARRESAARAIAASVLSYGYSNSRIEATSAPDGSVEVRFERRTLTAAFDANPRGRMRRGRPEPRVSVTLSIDARGQIGEAVVSDPESQPPRLDF